MADQNTLATQRMRVHPCSPVHTLRWDQTGESSENGAWAVASRPSWLLRVAETAALGGSQARDRQMQTGGHQSGKQVMMHHTLAETARLRMDGKRACFFLLRHTKVENQKNSKLPGNLHGYRLKSTKNRSTVVLYMCWYSQTGCLCMFSDFCACRGISVALES